MVHKAGSSARLTDVATAAGVSRTAAAKVLLGTGGDHVRVGDEARSRIEAAAQALGYRPNRAAQQLRGARTQTLGVLMDTVNAPVMNDRLAAVEREAAARGYRLLIGQLHGSRSFLEAYLSDFDSRGVDALLCLFDLSTTRARQFRPLLANRDDVVYHGRRIGDRGGCVRVDTADAIRQLVEHMLARGRRRIGIELWNMDDELMTVRHDAYLANLQANGCAFDTGLIWSKQPDSVTPSPEDFDSVVESLVVRNGADALIASNDIWAVHLIQSLKKRGYRIPDDVAVTGYDNLDIGCVIEPAVTTIDQQHTLYAAAALDLLVSAATGALPPPPQCTATITPALVIRASTNPPTHKLSAPKLPPHDSVLAPRLLGVAQ